jgi:hypothetical protein
MARAKTLTDWNAEDMFWRDEFKNRSYASDWDYEYWRPAYRYGFDAAERYPGKRWDQIERDLETGWRSYHEHDERSTWEQVKDAVRDAWNRVTARM